MLLELRYLLADLRLTLARRRFGRALDQLMRKYRPDQPRMSRGVPEGGEWTVDPNSARQQALARRNAFAWPWGRSVMVSPADAKWEGLSVLLAMSKSAARGYACPVQ